VRTYTISGSSSGIGLAIRETLERAGHRVIGVDISDAEVIADLGRPDGRLDAVRKVLEMSGERLHGVVASAGVSPSHSVDSILSVNFFGARDFLDALAPAMEGANVGAVAIASAATQHPVCHEAVRALLDGSVEQASDALKSDAAAAYVASKTALVRWVRRAATSKEWAGAGRSLNAVSPGIVATPMNRDLSAEAKERLMERYPMRLHGVAQAAAVASLVCYLVGDTNSHVTGQNIFVDGGAEAVTRGDVVW